jgi:hypothetical protein
MSSKTVQIRDNHRIRVGDVTTSSLPEVLQREFLEEPVSDRTLQRGAHAQVSALHYGALGHGRRQREAFTRGARFLR